MYFTLIVAVASFFVANFSEICEVCRRRFAGDAGVQIGVVRVSLAGDTKVGDLLERFWPKRKRAGGDLGVSPQRALCG